MKKEDEIKFIEEFIKWSTKYLVEAQVYNLQNDKIKQMRILAQSWLHEEERKDIE